MFLKTKNNLTFKIIFFIATIILIFLILINVSYSRKILKIFYNLAQIESLKFQFTRCVSNDLIKENFTTILIAGHTYGLPSHKNNATYPKFLYALESETKDKKVDQIILLGDIVKKARLKNFKEVKNEFNVFTNSLLVAPGNHDFGPIVLGNKANQTDFLKVFEKSFQMFKFENNLFFILDTASITGNLTNEQFLFIKEKITKHTNIENIFIFTHHVIWSDYMDKIGIHISPNVYETIKKNNFNELYSIVKNINVNKKIYFFAGDIGVSPNHTKLFCKSIDDIYFIASGMGNGKLDNYLRLKISSDGKAVSIEPIFF